MPPPGDGGCFVVVVCRLAASLSHNIFSSLVYTRSHTLHQKKQEAATPAEGDATSKLPETEPVAVIPSLDESTLKEAFLKFATEVRGSLEEEGQKHLHALRVEERRTFPPLL